MKQPSARRWTGGEGDGSPIAAAAGYNRNMQMRAAIFHGGRRISVEDVTVPDPAADEVRVRVHAAGVCGGDLKNLHKDLAERFGPKTWGHELAGQIDAVE